MNNRLIFFSLIFLTTQTHAMKRPRQKLQPVATYTKFPDYKYWPEDIQNIIIDLSTHNTIARKPKDAAKTVRALAITNKKLNLLINNPNFSSNLIKNLSCKFYCSHETIAKFLCTREAAKRLALQRELKQLCLFEDPFGFSPHTKELAAQELKRLIRIGVDLEFTYNHEGVHKTPLMLSMEHDNNIYKDLLNEKININSCNAHGLTALKFATEWVIHPRIYKALLSRSDISINQQNRHGESTLLHCLVHRKRFQMTNVFINTIKRLLKAGADPELANNYGLTPLDAAIELRNEEVIRKIQRAIEKKHS